MSYIVTYKCRDTLHFETKNPLAAGIGNGIGDLAQALVYSFYNLIRGHALGVNDRRLSRGFTHSHHVLILTGNYAAIAILQISAVHGNDLMSILLKSVLYIVQAVFYRNFCHGFSSLLFHAVVCPGCFPFYTCYFNRKNRIEMEKPIFL